MIDSHIGLARHAEGKARRKDPVLKVALMIVVHAGVGAWPVRQQAMAFRRLPAIVVRGFPVANIDAIEITQRGRHPRAAIRIVAVKVVVLVRSAGSQDIAGTGRVVTAAVVSLGGSSLSGHRPFTRGKVAQIDRTDAIP